MGEKKVGFVPRIVIRGSLGPKEYGLLITNERSIFVLERYPKTMLAGIAGGVIGAALAESVSSKKEIDYVHEPIEVLASLRGSISVPHSSILGIAVNRKLSSHYLKIRYSGSGHKKKIDALLAPPTALVAEKQIQGKRKKEISREYAREVWKAFEKALPPEIVQHAKVRL